MGRQIQAYAASIGGVEWGNKMAGLWELKAHTTKYTQADHIFKSFLKDSIV